MIITKMKAGEPIKSGDLVAVSKDGKVRYVEEGSLTRAIHIPEDVNFQNAVTEIQILGMEPMKGASQKAIACAHLPNGNYAFVHTASNQYQFALFSADRSLIAQQVFGIALDDAEVAIAATQDNGVVIALKLGTTGCVQVIALNDQGEVTNSEVLNESSNLSTSLGVAVLTSGKVIVTYSNENGKHEIYAAILDATLAQCTQRRIDWFDDITPLRQSVQVVALTGGGYVIAYGAAESGTGKVFFKLFDANDNLVSARVQVGEDLTEARFSPNVCAAALTGGGFAIGSYGGTGPGYQLNIYGADGTNYGGNIILDPCKNGDQGNCMDLAGLDNGNVAVVWKSIHACGSAYTPAGQVVFSKASYGPCRGSVAVAAAPGGAVVAHQGLDPESSDHVVFAGHVGPMMYGDVSMTTMPVGVPYAAIVVGHLMSTLPYPDSQQMFACTNTYENLVQIDVLSTYSQEAQVVIGVATSDADVDEDVEVCVEGTVELRVPFKLPHAGDYRYRGVIPGQQLAIIGNTAILKGIQ